MKRTKTDGYYGLAGSALLLYGHTCTAVGYEETNQSNTQE